MAGLVVKREGQLQVYNPIYAAVFDDAWIDAELKKLRPYAESFRAWIASDKTDRSRLLRGDALTEAEHWATERTPSAEDREFLSASRIQQQEAAIAAKEREAELAREKAAREAAEAAEQIQVEANRQAQRTIRRGSLVLGGALVAALVLGGLALVAGNRLRVTNQQRDEAKAELARAENNLEAINIHIEMVNELDSLVDELYEYNKPEAAGKPEAAEDAIAHIGLSFTNFTGDRPELKQALLNSSIALAHLHLIPFPSDDGNEAAQARIDEAQTRINQSVQLIESNPNLFDSLVSGRAIAFFTYAVEGNLREEQAYFQEAPVLTSGHSSYEQAFHYTSAKPNFNSEAAADSFWRLLGWGPSSDESEGEQFQALVTAALKKHYDFQAKQLIRELEPTLAQYHWRAADELTWDALAALAYSRDVNFADANIACPSLRAINTLWVEHSAGHFGFSVQKEISLETGNIPGQYNETGWIQFGNRVGWHRISEQNDWLFYEELSWNWQGREDSTTPRGHLPTWWYREVTTVKRVSSVSSLGARNQVERISSPSGRPRIMTCDL